jgi:SAM-dependent methyltransferase
LKAPRLNRYRHGVGDGGDFDAVEAHSREAEEFRRRYRVLERDIYGSTFTYGRAKIDRLLYDVVDRLPTGSSVLDVGCGTGYTLAKLRDRGLTVTGVEPAVEMRRIARENLPGVPILDARIEALPFSDETFDFIVSIEVVRYLDDLEIAIGDLARVLRPGGTAFITASSRWSLNGYAAVNAVASRMKVPGLSPLKQSFTSVRDGTDVFRRVGFGDVEVHGVFFGPWKALQRISPRALRGALKAFEPLDDRLGRRSSLRNLSNHLVYIAHRA